MQIETMRILWYKHVLQCFSNRILLENVIIAIIVSLPCLSLMLSHSFSCSHLRKYRLKRGLLFFLFYFYLSMRYTSKSNVRLLSLCFLFLFLLYLVERAHLASRHQSSWQMTGNEKVCFPFQLSVRHIVQLFDCSGFSRLGKFVFV